MIDPITGLPSGDPNQMQTMTGQNPQPLYAQTNTGAQTPTNAAGGGSLFGNFDSMSDNDLFSLASSLGIDANQFMGGGGNENLDMFQIDPAVSKAVSQIYQSQRDLGNDQLRRSAIEMAGGRGLNTTDTPIFDPYLRNQAVFESQLRGNEASTTLGLAQDYNKQRDTFLSGLFNTQQQLQQQAQTNRMAMANTGSGVGLGLNDARMRRPTGSTVTTSGVNGQQLSSGIGAIGAGLSGLSSLFGGGNGGLIGGLLRGLGLGDSGVLDGATFSNPDPNGSVLGGFDFGGGNAFDLQDALSALGGGIDWGNLGSFGGDAGSILGGFDFGGGNAFDWGSI